MVNIKDKQKKHEDTTHKGDHNFKKERSSVLVFEICQ